MIDDGSTLLVISVGDSILPSSFRMLNILVTPNIIQNLSFVHQFTTNNSCFLEFDPFGFFVKDLTIHRILVDVTSLDPSTLFVF